jgi:hypothetical protein
MVKNNSTQNINYYWEIMATMSRANYAGIKFNWKPKKAFSHASQPFASDFIHGEN